MYNKLSPYLNKKSDNVAKILDHLLNLLGQITGKKHKVEFKKNSLHIVDNKAFLGIHFLKDILRINIVLKHSIQTSLPYKLDKPSKNVFHNYVDLQTPVDLNLVKKYIVEAYEVQR